jgi:protein-tyrosine phosphatase
MDRYNYEDVISLAKSKEQRQKVNYLLNVVEPNSNNEVPDPYYGTQKDFEEVYDLVDHAIDQLIDKLEIKK